jgi:hypothetical protein
MSKDQSTNDPNQEHPYDNPGLSPLEFLLAIVHDRALPIRTRIVAARYAIPLTESPVGTRLMGDLVIKVPTLQ